MTFTFAQSEPPNVLKLLAHEVRWQLLSALAYSDFRVNELGTLLRKPLNLVSYHLRLLRNEALVQERRSSADGRDVYYSLDFARIQTLYTVAAESLHPALTTPQPGSVDQAPASNQPPPRILFLCTHNSARSQIAEALLRHLGGDRVVAFSAGSEPSRVHPKAIETLQKAGVDSAGLSSKHLDQFVGQPFDYVITVCDNANESCPIFPGDPQRIHWSFPDPSAVADPDEQNLVFMQVLAGLEKRLKILLALLDRQRGAE